MKCSILIIVLSILSINCQSLDDIDDEEDIYQARGNAFKSKLQEKQMGTLRDEQSGGLFGNSIDKVMKYCSIVTDEIMMDAIGIPQPINQVLFIGVLWFVTYISTKLTYMVLSICYGSKKVKSQQQGTSNKADEALLNMIADQVKQLSIKMNDLQSSQSQSSGGNPQITNLKNKIDQLQGQVSQNRNSHVIQQFCQHMEGVNEKIEYIQAQIATTEQSDIALIKKIQNSVSASSVQIIQPVAPQLSSNEKPTQKPLEKESQNQMVTPRQRNENVEQQSQRKGRRASKSPINGRNLSKSPIGRKNPASKVPQLNLGGHQGQAAVTGFNSQPLQQEEQAVEEEEYYYDEEEAEEEGQEYGAEQVEAGGSSHIDV